MAFDASSVKTDGTTGSVSLTASDYTTITYFSLNYDTGNNFTLSTGKFTAPAAGIWNFSASAEIAALAATTEAFCLLVKNGTRDTTKKQGSATWTSGASQALNPVIAGDFLLAAGDTIEFQVWISVAGASVTQGHFCGHQVT